MIGDATWKVRQGDQPQADPNAGPAPARASGYDAWRVVRTGARREKIVARQCGTAGIAYFLPVVRVAREYAGATCRVEIPLIANFLFARADEAALRAADVSGSIRTVADAPQRALGWQLPSLARALDRHARLEPVPTLANARHVEVRVGDLTGVQGLVDGALADAQRLVLQVDALGLAFSIQIEGVALAPVESDVGE